MNKTLSIPEWHQLAREGTKLPVRIPLAGWSMFPLVRYNKDYVTIVPLDSVPRIGDIVLYVEKNGERYVMHRVWEVREQEVLTWGDNCRYPDGWCPLEAVWGKAVLIERGIRKIEPDPARGMKWARFWHKAGIIYRLYKRYRDAVIRRIKKLKVWGNK